MSDSYLSYIWHEDHPKVITKGVDYMCQITCEDLLAGEHGIRVGYTWFYLNHTVDMCVKTYNMYSIIESTVKSSYGILYQKLMLKIKHQSHTQLSK